MKRTAPSAAPPVASTVGIWIELLFLNTEVTALVTQRSPGSLRKFCKRHGIRIRTIPGERRDAAGNAEIDHQHGRKYILYSEFIKGCERAAEKGEQ